MIWRYLVETGFFLGMIVNALLFIPQAIKLYKVKTTKEISFLTFLGFNIIQMFTAIHAYLVHDYLLLIGSILALITCGMVTFLAIKYHYRRE